MRSCCINHLPSLQQMKWSGAASDAGLLVMRELLTYLPLNSLNPTRLAMVKSWFIRSPFSVLTTGREGGCAALES